MIENTVKLTLNGEETEVPLFRFTAAVVGSGAAGLNCADLLAAKGVRTVLVTEGMNMGTSRNTGSDKQTYYKLTLADGAADSVEDMARSLFSGGAMHGDLALCEAAGSVGAFIRLTELGVPFPHNEYGEFVGYQTDHDTRTRATSCGPLTSKFMTEALERSVRSRNVPILDGYRAVKLIVNEGRAAGIAAISEECEKYNKYGLALILADNVVWATGGPSAIYASTVYPESQTCAHGAPLEAGAAAVNVTESQYGIASVKFRWNLSGTYQQVLPRYISTLPDGTDEREFLAESFPDAKKELTAIFRKGYQWPFDPAKLTDGGSSNVDMAVFAEMQKGRRVYMDFRRNPSRSESNGRFDKSLIGAEAVDYLTRSGAFQLTPIERLKHMNTPAIELYASHGIDLFTEPLEIAVCAQHNNGGFAVNVNYESTTLPSLYVIGEAAGVFGIHRPGGSALNSTQVSSRRAADHISRKPIAAVSEPPFDILGGIAEMYSESSTLTVAEILDKRLEYGRRMSACGAFNRPEAEIVKAAAEVRAELGGFKKYKAASVKALTELSINRDILVTQLVYLEAILEYIDHGGISRGSYIIRREDGKGIGETDTAHRQTVCETRISQGEIVHSWQAVRPIPERDNWFENVYNRFISQRI